VRNELRSRLGQYDVLLTPTAPAAAPKLDENVRQFDEFYRMV